ncbi:Sua5/YciO/YrdC/YwlC family protein [Halobacteriovorax sp. JY17]|uniref:Sua5/YciO/YrdC/YwlC family protein n=1 Tax=Halobacteriovorax sp. JY17 TaxID=2014617 RepID=UPI000C4B88EF|nr:Sua5/YciO/YrdC/YwlC family protein [Halobacteriovorax sp. JY17]PIK16465.1 MAG: hypothetical protein CES88_06920 [Halobacteriovorax sp. JY17]
MKKKLFVYPTDTVWGIGGSIFSKECYDKIALIKGHANKKPLSIVFQSFEMINEYINLPKEFSREWLNKFFEFESTIGVPKQWAKVDLPVWICQDSDYLTIRCMDTDELRPIFREVGGPITSTSLNLTKRPPIISLSDADDFFHKFMSNEYFSGQTETKCSGRSSTIVLYSNSGVQIVREGKYIEEIREHFKLLSTTFL